MAVRKPFLLRIDAAVLEALQRWANADLRSLNGQIEFLLRQSLRAAGRLPQPRDGDEPGLSARPTKREAGGPPERVSKKP